MEIGNANYDKKGKANIFKIEDGDNIYRIFPALGSMAKSGKWFSYKKVEWGYKTTAGKNRPFQDPSEQDFKSKMWTVDTEARRKRDDIEKKHKIASEMYKNREISKEQMQQVTDLKKQFNLDKKYYVNAINLKGEIGLLKIGYKAFKALEVEIKKLRDTGVDPLSVDNGRFFNFFRSGQNFDTAYSVSVVQENVKAMIDGQETIVQRPLKHVLDSSILARLDSEAKDLVELDKMYPILTPAQVDRIVKEGPKAVDELLGAGDNQPAEENPEEDSAPAQSSSQAAGASSTPAPEAQASAPKEEPKQEQKEEPKKEEAQQAPAPTPDKAAFLASLGIS
jgi:hypothetical protein